MTHVLLTWVSHLYLLAAILYLVNFVREHAKVALSASLVLGAGFLLHTALIAALFVGQTYLSLSTGLSLLGWALAGGFLVLQRFYKLPEMGVFVTPLLVTVVIPAVLLHQGGTSLPDELRIRAMPAHILISFVGLALFALATGVSLAYLVLQRQMKSKHFGMLFSRLPSLEALDGMSTVLIRWGFVALTLTMMSGFYMAKKVWGHYWRWDPKLTMSIVGWLIFAGLVQARIFAGWRGRRVAVLTALGFLMVFGAYFGMKVLPAGSLAGVVQP